MSRDSRSLSASILNR